MSLTPSQQIDADRAKLEAALADPEITDKRHIYQQLRELPASSSNSGSAAADVTSGIDGSADIEAIKNLISDLKNELINTTAIADLLIQDSGTTPRYFIRQDKIDQTTGLFAAPTIVNLDGSAPSPAPVPPLLPIKAGSSNLINEDLYVAASAGTGYAIGDSIANVRLLNGETGLVVVSSWYNITQRAPIATAPSIAHLKGYEDKLEELLSAILGAHGSSNASLLNLEVELGNNSDTTIPANNLDPATLKGLIRRSNELIEIANPIDTIGDIIDTSIPADPTQLATLKGIDRGIWQTLIDKRQFTRLSDGNNDAVIKDIAPEQSDPALVVAVSPNSGLVPAGTVVAGESIATGSGFLGWASWIAKNVVAILGSIGLPADTFAASDAGVSSQIGLLKRLNLKIQQGLQPIGQAVSVVLAQKTTITGLPSTGVATNNLLDPTGAGIATDVRAFRSTRIAINTAAQSLFYAVSGAIDANFTVGVVTLQAIATNPNATPGSLSTAALVNQPANSATTNDYDLSNVNYLRVASLTAGGTGAVVTGTFNVMPILNGIRPTTYIASGQSVGVSSAQLAAAGVSFDAVSATIASNNTVNLVQLATGLSHTIAISVSGATGSAPTLDTEIQESLDNGTTWQTIYRFDRISAPGFYVSPQLPIRASNLRYVETLGGGTPSFTRTIIRNISNAATPYSPISRKLSAFNATNQGIEMLVKGRVRRMSANNRTSSLYFIQVHDKATAVANGDIPIEIFQLPAASTVPFTAADLGQFGTVLAAAVNPRVVISSAFNIYTAPNPISANLLHLFVEIL